MRPPKGGAKQVDRGHAAVRRDDLDFERVVRDRSRRAVAARCLREPGVPPPMREFVPEDDAMMGDGRRFRLADHDAYVDANLGEPIDRWRDGTVFPGLAEHAKGAFQRLRIDRSNRLIRSENLRSARPNAPRRGDRSPPCVRARGPVCQRHARTQRGVRRGHGRAAPAAA